MTSPETSLANLNALDITELTHRHSDNGDTEYKANAEREEESKSRLESCRTKTVRFQQMGGAAAVRVRGRGDVGVQVVAHLHERREHTPTITRISVCGMKSYTTECQLLL